MIISVDYRVKSKKREFDLSVGKKSFLTAADGKNSFTVSPTRWCDETTSGHFLPGSVNHRPANVFNLSVILMFGYRVNGHRDEEFRKLSSKGVHFSPLQENNIKRPVISTLRTDLFYKVLLTINY